VTYTKNVADRLPKDPYWTDTMIYQMINYHKAGWYDDLRYISPLVGLDDTVGDGSDKLKDLNRDALEAMVLMWAKKAGLVVQRTFGGRVEEQVALPDELPIATQKVITMGSFSVTVPKEVLLNPGGWAIDDPTASIPTCENGQIRTQRFMVYKTTPAFDDLVKNSGLMVWRVKRVVNEYRLGIYKGLQTDQVERKDFIYKLVLNMLTRSLLHRIVKR